MSAIESLRLNAIRNIREAELSCHPQFNVIYGENGSGKTSLLEGIHLLAHGKSFRTSHTDSLINDEAEESLVFARTRSGHRIGMSRHRRQGQQLRLDEQTQSNWDRVTKLFPVLVLDSSAFRLLEGGPRVRRQFLDWGVFHVEPSFLQDWRRMGKSLANRNQLLKQSRVDLEQLAAWDHELNEASHRVDQARQEYINKLLPIFRAVYPDLTGSEPPFDLTLTYERGWPGEATLLEVLSAYRSQDLKYRATQYGPQRADVVIKADNHKALEVLSRGQQKMLVSALKVAQGKFLSEAHHQQCLYLVDDLPAELDDRNRASVLSYLAGMGSQLFITCVERTALDSGAPAGLDYAPFHVERGKIIESK